MLSKLLRSRTPVVPVASTVPDGERIYAIGDVHGRLDLLDRLLEQIDDDEARRGPMQTQLVFLGDLVDRGPDSAGVVDRLRCLPTGDRPARFLLGNHEEVFLSALDGDRRALRAFCRIGGRETVLSYGVSPSDYERMDYDQLAAALSELIPATHRAFLASFEDLIVLGDYAFAHAGVRPATALSEQRTADLRWIRTPFLDHRGPLEKVIVHGHTIRAEVEWRPHRIGIDTGAYESGRLSALGLEGADRWVLQT